MEMGTTRLQQAGAAALPPVLVAFFLVRCRGLWVLGLRPATAAA
jgi:hypothetical protein